MAVFADVLDCLDEQEFAPSEQASRSVDALVNDIDTDSLMGLPTSGSRILEQPRRSTPTIPPGFSAPATPRLLVDQPLRPLSRTAMTTITPAVPVIPATPLRIATPVKPRKDRKPADMSEDHAGIGASGETCVSDSPTSLDKNKAGQRSTASKSDLPTARTPMGALDKTNQLKKDIKFTGDSSIPLEAMNLKLPPKVESRSKRMISDFTPITKINSTASAESSPQKGTKSASKTASGSTKRQPPGRLDIAAATKLSDKYINESPATPTATKSDTQAKNPRAVSLASTASHPPSPSIPSTGSPVKRTAPRTIRVVPMPKSENLPPLSASSAASMPPLPTVGKLRSRQASVTSINRPGTPVSEFVSDNASITSTSISRANSPPPGGKVGSAPIRKKTKTQAKKERQERAKQIAEEKIMVMEDFVKSSDPEPVQAPIIGRKKKAKRQVSGSAIVASTPTLSRLSSPKSTKREKAEEEREAAESSSSAPAPAVKPSAPTAKKSSPVKPSSPRKSSPASDDPSSSNMSTQPQPTAASILADLQRTGELLASTLEFFKPLSSSLSHRTASPVSPCTDANGMPSPPDLKIHFSEADLDALTKKLPVHLGGDDGKTSSRTLITPQGKFLWGLSKELEERVLELEKRVEEVRGVGRWRPRNASGRKPAADTQGALGGRKSKRGGGGGGSSGGDFRTDVLPAIATALKEAGAKLGKQQQQQASAASISGSGSSASAGPSASTAAAAAKSVAAQKHHTSFDDALGYLNQWVLPTTDPAASGGLHSVHHHHHHHHHQPQQPSVGPPPPSSTSLLSAAKLAAGSGAATALPIPDLENLGVFAAEVLGGYVVQGLEALVGVGAGVGGTTFGPACTGTGAGAGGEGGGGAGGVLGVEEAEQAMLQSRHEAEQLGKKFNTLVKRNRRVLFGAVGGG